jgi:hypothetical protein
VSDANPGRYPLTESEKAERKRRAREAAAELDQKYPQGLPGGVYGVLAELGSKLAGAGQDLAGDEYAAFERNLLRVWAPTDLKVALAVASGRLTRRAWDEMGPAGREKLFRPHGFRAWEQGRS